MKKTIIVTAPTSGLGKALLHGLAPDNNLVLCGRDSVEIKKIAADLKIRYGCNVWHFQFEATKTKTHDALMKKIIRRISNIDGIIMVHGYLNPNDSIALNDQEIQKIITINHTSIVTLSTAFARHCATAKFMAVITSIAGVRGKKRNLIYNAAKGATSIYLEGLRQAVRPMQITEIRPGFIDTNMTFGKITSPLIATPQHVATDIIRAIANKKRIAYTPWFWKYIMLILRHLPGAIYDRLKL